jgi:hypothetical protein
MMTKSSWWIPGELEGRQPHALIHDLIGADICWRFKSGRATARYIVVLIHSVAAHT